MVCRLIALILLFSISAQAATPGLLLDWSGSKSPRCQKLVEDFLAELRSMANDRPIELEAVTSDEHAAQTMNPAIRLQLSCIEPQNGDSGAVSVSDNQTTIRLHYVPKAEGFDAMDWLAFQKRYLQIPQDISLAPTQAKRDLANIAPPALDESNRLSAVDKLSSTPFYQHWWFWSLVGVAGAGIYALTRAASSRDSSLNVEIH